MKKQLLKKQEVARILSLSIGQINYLIEQNKLETVEVKSGILRIKESSVVKYLNIKPEVGMTLSRVFAILWIVAIIVFFIQVWLIEVFSSEIMGWTSGLAVVNIGFGVMFFLAAFLTIGKKSTKNILLPKKFNILYLSLIYLLIATIPVLAEGSIEAEKKTNLPTPTPTQYKYAPTPTPTPKQVKNTIKANPTPVVSDPIIDCKSSHPNCSGSSIRVRQSQCSLIYCCQVGNTWSVYPSSDKCREAQNNAQPKQAYPTVTPYPTYRAPTYAPTATPTYTTTTPYPTLTPLPTPNQALITYCKDSCRNIGAAGERRINELWKSIGYDNSFYRDEISSNTEWTNNCVNDCNTK